MSVFGGVQVINILCSVVRNKLVAIWIGAAGVGLFGVYNTAVDFINQLALLGIASTGTREVARHAGDAASTRRTVTAVRRWCLCLALIGAAITFFCAPWLSEWSFGDDAHAGSFRWLSLAVLMMGLTQGWQSVLQGLSRLRQVARSSLWGSVGGTALAIPLFYFLRIDSIVPVIILTAACLLAGVLVNSRLDDGDSRLTARGTFAAGSGLIKLGFLITMSSLATLGASYVLMAWFTSRHGSDVAGLYQAGFTLINRYVGLVFTAISMEYFPRLAGVAMRKRVSEIYVSHELVIALSVLVPLVGVFALFAPYLVELFYSSKFEQIVPFVVIGVGGTIFRAISWCMAFTMLTRGDGPIYLVTEVLSAVAYVVINILIYDTAGFAGMGFAYIAWYGFYTLIVGAVYRWRYGLRLRPGVAAASVVAVAAAGVLVASAACAPWWVSAILTVAAAVMSLRVLARKMSR